MYNDPTRLQYISRCHYVHLEAKEAMGAVMTIDTLCTYATGSTAWASGPVYFSAEGSAAFVLALKS